MKRLVAFLPLVVLVVLAAVFAFKSLGRDPQVTTHAMVGKPAPTLDLPLLWNRPVDAIIGEPPPGKPYLVNFFASWCAPCIVEAPTLMKLKAEGVEIVGVAYKDDRAKTIDFLARHGDPYAWVVLDEKGRKGMDYGVTGPPETYLVGSDGAIIDKYVGALDERAARTLLAKAR